MRRIRWTAFVVAWAVLLLVDVFYVPDLMNSHHGPTRGLGYLFGALPWVMLAIAAHRLYVLWRLRRMADD